MDVRYQIKVISNRTDYMISHRIYISDYVIMDIRQSDQILDQIYHPI